jgi:hypothetical protein
MRISALVMVAGLATASAASAQTISSFTLNDGAGTSGFRYHENTITGASARTGTGGGSANFGFQNATATSTAVNSDYLFQNWWWYRSANDTREFGMSNQTFGTQLGANSAFLRYVEPIGNNATANGTLTFEFTYTLNQISATQAAVTINWSIINNTQTEQPVSFFGYTDSDIGSFSANSGNYIVGTGVNTLRNDVTTTNNTQFFTMSADLTLNDEWRIAPFSTTGTTAPLARLGNTTVENMGNVDVSPGAADFTGALQYNLIIPANGTVGGRVTKGYNYVVPAPGAMALLGMGGLLAARRRR